MGSSRTSFRRGGVMLSLAGSAPTPLTNNSGKSHTCSKSHSPHRLQFGQLPVVEPWSSLRGPISSQRPIWIRRSRSHLSILNWHFRCRGHGAPVCRIIRYDAALRGRRVQLTSDMLTEDTLAEEISIQC